MSEEPETETDELEDQLREMQESEREKTGEGEENAPEESQQQQQAEAKEPDGGDEAKAAAAEEPQVVPLNVALGWKQEGKELRRAVTDLENQIKELAGSIGKTKAPEEQAPDFDTQPVEYLAYQQRQQTRLIEELQKALNDSTVRGQQQVMQSEVNAIEQRFASKTPDYFEATAYLTQRRVNELQSLYGFTEEQAQQRFAEETARFINTATQAGESFAEKAYKLAQGLGYKSKVAPAAQAENGAAKSLKDLARRQQNARSLQGVSGTSPKEEMSPEDAADLPNDEFDKQFVGEEGDKRFRELFGG